MQQATIGNADGNRDVLGRTAAHRGEPFACAVHAMIWRPFAGAGSGSPGGPAGPKACGRSCPRAGAWAAQLAVRAVLILDTCEKPSATRACGGRPPTEFETLYEHGYLIILVA